MAFTYGFWHNGVELTGSDSSVTATLENTLNKCLVGYGPYSDFPTAATYTSTTNPGNEGMLALATDTNLLYLSKGGSWVLIGFVPPASLAQGDIFYWNGTTLARLAASTSGYYLKTYGAGANPGWASVVNFSTQTDATASRAIDGTIYHNTGSTPMMVTVTLAGGPSADARFFCDSGSSPTTKVAEFVNAAGYSATTFMVLPGYYYKVTIVGGSPSLLTWIEWN